MGLHDHAVAPFVLASCPFAYLLRTTNRQHTSNNETNWKVANLRQYKSAHAL
jgi:hypothetical protein